MRLGIETPTSMKLSTTSSRARFHSAHYAHAVCLTWAEQTRLSQSHHRSTEMLNLYSANGESMVPHLICKFAASSIMFSTD